MLSRITSDASKVRENPRNSVEFPRDSKRSWDTTRDFWKSLEFQEKDSTVWESSVMFIWIILPIVYFIKQKYFIIFRMILQIIYHIYYYPFKSFYKYCKSREILSKIFKYEYFFLWYREKLKEIFTEESQLLSRITSDASKVRENPRNSVGFPRDSKRFWDTTRDFRKSSEFQEKDYKDSTT